jgi:hypothetical protein
MFVVLGLLIPALFFNHPWAFNGVHGELELLSSP